jgi:hypothetical protein
MTSIYLSSTYADLSDHRRAVAEQLRKCNYAVDAMEQYAARDERPRQACEEDVAKRDVYVGLFGWRYGYVPDTPANAKSITELEYLAAGRASKPRLVFLAETGAPLDPALEDRPGSPARAALDALRDQLTGDRWVSFFRSPEDLTLKVITSIIQLECTSEDEELDAVARLQQAPDLGPSYLGNVQAQIQQLSDAKFVAITVGDATPAIWWNTRLHLVASLASDFTDIAQIVLYGRDGQLLAMADPAEVRRALAKSESRLELAYLNAREQGRNYGGSDIERTIFAYTAAVTQAFGKSERDAVDVLHSRRIQDLGIRSSGEAMEIGDRPFSAIRTALLQKTPQYVLLTRNGRHDGIVDRLELSSRIAALTTAR